MVIWFKPGYIYGGGDVGLPTYNPLRILEVVKNVWWESSAPGFPRPQGVTAIPSYAVMALGQKLGLTEVGLQAGLYGLLFLMMLQGMYWLSWEILGKNKYLSLLASVVYAFHPNLMIQVWHRFVQTGFYFAAALPFLLLLWQKWLSEAKRRYLVAFLVITIFSASIFSTMGYLITFWMILGLHWLVEVFVPWKNKQVMIKYGLRFVVGMISWFGVCVWWLWPIFAAIPAVVSTQHSVGQSVSNLLTLSGQTLAPYTLQGINPYYLFYEKDWGEIYSSPFFVLIPWVITICGLWGTWLALKSKKMVFWGLLLVLAIAISKGAAAPFGNAFVTVFNKFFILGVLRNPFEKVGIIIPLCYAILISVGFEKIFISLKKQNHKRIAVLCCVSVAAVQVFVWGWPFWTGKMFGTAKQPAYVKVPSSYAEVDEWLKGKGNGGRILHLPLTSTEAIAYKWEQGYAGAEPSQLLFSSMPSWSQGFNLQNIDELSKTVQMYIRNLSEDKKVGFQDLLQKMNISYIVLHLDTIPNDADVDSPVFVRSQIETLPYVRPVHQNGDLLVYQVVSGNELNKEIVFSTNLTSIEFGKDNKYWPWLAKNSSSHFVSQFGSDLTNQLKHGSDIVVSEKTFTSMRAPSSDMVSLLDKLPPVRVLPGSKFYKLIEIKERIETPWILNSKQAIVKLNFAGKRLVEVNKLVETANSTYISDTLLRYQELLAYLFSVLNTSLPHDRATVNDIFANHLNILEILEKKNLDSRYLNEITKTKLMLKDYLIKYEIVPKYETPNSTSVIYGFNTYEDKYQVLVPESNLVSLAEDVNLQVDGDLVKTKKIQIGDFWKVADLNLSTGYHEIGFVSPSTPLIVDKEMVLVTPEKSSIDHTIPLTPLLTEGVYTLNFEYWIQKGDNFSISLNQDSDVLGKDGRKRRSENSFGIDNYNRYWRQGSISFKIRETTREANITIHADPWDDCKIIIARRDLCKDLNFKSNFQRSTLVLLRSMTLTRSINLPMFLKSSTHQSSPALETDAEIRDYQKLPMNRYRGSFTADKPGMLFLLQTYDPGWKLKLVGPRDTTKPLEKYLIDYYSNGWKIDVPGEYKFDIYYEPQQNLRKGLYIGLGMLFISFIIPKSWYEKKSN